MSEKYERIKANYERWVGSKSHTNMREVGASYKKQSKQEIRS